MAGSDEQRDSAAGSSAGEPGAISRLLVEIFQIPEGDLAASWREPLKPGDAVGRYQIRNEIGRGGFGAVYEAFDPELGRTVALKALKPGRTKHQFSEAWIKKEAEAVAKLDHPAIVTIFDVGTCPAGAYLVMELLRGETLAKRIEKGPLPVGEALRVAEHMAEGLAHAHSRGVLHRDLKPANVFVCEDGRVKLLDFGLAHLLGTEGSSGAGTPAYMAPEQAAGVAVNERADVWAAGMVLGEMLTGKRPVERTPTPARVQVPTADQTALMWEAPAVSPSLGTSTRQKLTGVPRPLARAVEAAVSEDPQARPRDGNAWLAELRSARSLVERPRRVRRIAVLAGIGAILGLAVAGFATWRIWERQIPGGRPTVAVADFANETGDSEFDGISGLLITSLEQGTQLRVLTRGRMLDILKQLGKPDVRRIDEPLAREVGREARANALLLASIRKLGSAYVVEMRALDPLHDEYVFTTREQASVKEAVFQLVDRLAATTRKKLGVTVSDSAPVPPIAAITTTNPKAWELFSQGRRAHEKTEGAEAQRLLQLALEVDPTFALARYQVAVVAWERRGEIPKDVEEAKSRVEDAWAVADRLPEKERMILSGIRAETQARWAEAARAFSQAAATYPLDKEILYFAAAASATQDREDALVSFLERAVQLDPDFAPAVQSLVTAYAKSGRTSQHLDWLLHQAAVARTALTQAAARQGPERRPFAEANTAEVVARALLSAGREAEALSLFRDASAASGSPWPPGAYVLFLFHAGRADEAATAIHATLAAREGTEASIRPRWVGTYEDLLTDSFIVRGMFSEVWPRIENARKRKYPAQLALLGQCLGGAIRSPDRLRAATEELIQLGALENPRLAGSAVLNLAEAGDLEGARALASRVTKDVPWTNMRPFERTLMEALARSTPNSLDDVALTLRAIPGFVDPDHRYDRSLVLGEVERARGDCHAAVAALERARAMRWMPGFFSFVWFRPGSLHSLATCYEKLGDLGKARERNEELLRLWVKADSDLPLLVEAKAMRERLAAK